MEQARGQTVHQMTRRLLLGRVMLGMGLFLTFVSKMNGIINYEYLISALFNEDYHQMKIKKKCIR